MTSNETLLVAKVCQLEYVVTLLAGIVCAGLPKPQSDKLKADLLHGAANMPWRGSFTPDREQFEALFQTELNSLMKGFVEVVDSSESELREGYQLGQPAAQDLLLQILSSMTQPKTGETL